MDHRRFLSSLSAEQRQELVALSDAKGLRHLVVHWGLIGLCSALIAAEVPGWPALMIVQGVLLVFLFTLLHETSHRTPFRSGWLNSFAGHMSGFIIFLPATWFRFFHLAHHRYTQMPGKDPELSEPKPESWTQYLRHVSGIPVWIAHAKTLVSNASDRRIGDFVPDARRKGVVIEARLYVIAYGLLFGLSLWRGSDLLLHLWIVPLLLGQPFLRLYLLAEHGRCPFVSNMFENTRTVFTNGFVRAISWNMPFHAEHHSYPTVPFHRLPELHNLAQRYLGVTAKGYASFNRSFCTGLGAEVRVGSKNVPLLARSSGMDFPSGHVERRERRFLRAEVEVHVE